jgi:hypothetical protein
VRSRFLGILVAALLPLAACEAGPDDEMDMDEGLETQPAAETTLGDETGMTSWDADTDMRLSRDEWRTSLAADGPYARWNTDDTDGVTNEEFAAGVRDFWDADDNDQLTEAEWNEGIDDWFSGAEYGEWGEWDANGDSFLDANEVAEGFERANLYDTVDRDSDALIDDEEIADWWFDIWDDNDDDFIDTTEWDRVGSEWSRVGTTM